MKILTPLPYAGRLAVWLALGWFVSGTLATTAGFLGLLQPIISLVLFWPIGFVLLIVAVGVRSIWHTTSLNRALVFFLLFIWCLHATGILVPETGFDAVWYHLPIVRAFTIENRLVFLEQYYQSVNPLFTDLIFLLGYQLGGEWGTKVVAYFFAVSLILISFVIARRWLSLSWSLVTIIVISLFQVVTWQASSFYVDVAKAFWEMSALYVVLVLAKRSHPTKMPVNALIIAGLFVGASLGTKAFSLLLLPIFSIIVWWQIPGISQTKLRAICLFLISCGLVALPFYLRSAWYTGQPFYSVALHVKDLVIENGRITTVWFLARFIVTLPISLWYFVTARDYLTILLVLWLPYLWYERKLFKTDRDLVQLGLFGLWQWGLWWFVPPLSTRYALSGFAILWIVKVIAVSHHFHRVKHSRVPIILTLMIVIFSQLVPRLAVVARNINYISGVQDKTTFLNQFLDGNVDDPLRRWHQF